jgi:LmbE family N-acetylglucosaminyl deacetylase
MRYPALLLLLALCAASALHADTTSPRVLIVTAHPDDETGMAATVWKITHALGGVVDLALVTNGEGGYKYSSLGNIIYGHELTNEDTGRALLPAIRKRELMAGGDIIGLRNYFFLDQRDHLYTLNVDSTFGSVWDTAHVVRRLAEIMRDGDYDYIFGLLPTPGTHGHHKGATIMALEAAARIAPAERPIVLGVSGSGAGDSVTPFRGLDGYARTAIAGGLPSFQFDRSATFGFKDQLTYSIIVNWVIAEHKSQGTMQLGVNGGDYEEFWWFEMNDARRFDETTTLFRRLAEPFFEPLEY